MPQRRNAFYLFIILALIGALATGRAFFFNVAYLLAGVLGCAWLWAWLSIHGIRITRHTNSDRFMVGAIIEERFTVANRGLLPKLFIEVRDESTLPNHRVSQVVPWLGWGSTFEWVAQTQCFTRGEFRLGGITITSGDPFGLFLLSRKLDATSAMLVYPASIPLARLALPAGGIAGGDMNRRRTQSVTTDAVGVREYAPGDSFNRIHWRSTARRGEIMVKEYETEPRLDVWMFVDFSAASLIEPPLLRRAGSNGQGAVIACDDNIPQSAEEYAVAIAASVASYFANIRRPIGFAAHLASRMVIPPEPGSRPIGRILELLAVARSIGTLPFAELIRLEAARIPRGSTLLLITSSLSTDWVGQAQIVARRGVKVVCIIFNPLTFGVTQPLSPVTDALHTYRIPSHVIRYGENIAAVLSQPAR